MEKDGSDSDQIVLVIENKEIQVSKRWLTKESGYFRSMFQLPMKESNEKRIVLQDASYDDFKYILDEEFDYRKDVVELIDIMFTADRFQFDDYLGLMGELIAKKIVFDEFNETLAWETYSRSDLLKTLKLESLLDSLHETMDSNAVRLLQHQSINEVPMSLIIDLIKRDTFAAPEEVILSSLVSYLNKNRTCDAKELLNHVRVNLIPKEETKKIIESSERDLTFLLDSKATFGRRVCKEAYKPMNEPPYTSGFEVTEHERTVRNKRRHLKKNKNQDEYVTKTHKVFMMPFKIAVYLNRIKFSLAVMDPKQKHQQYRFVLKVQRGEKWENIHDTVATNRQFQTTLRHKAMLKEGFISAIQLEVHPANFVIREFECFYKPDESGSLKSEGLSSFHPCDMSDTEFNDSDTDSDATYWSGACYDSDDDLIYLPNFLNDDSSDDGVFDFSDFMQYLIFKG